MAISCGGQLEFASPSPGLLAVAALVNGLSLRWKCAPLLAWDRQSCPLCDLDLSNALNRLSREPGSLAALGMTSWSSMVNAKNDQLPKSKAADWSVRPTFITTFYPFCGLGYVKACKVNLLFAFPRGDWRKRGLRGRLLGGEIDVHLRVLRFASSRGGALLLVLWCSHGFG